MSIRSRWRKVTSGLVVVAAVGAFASSPSGTETDPSEPLPLIVDLNGPRGVSSGPLGLVAYAEIDGSFSALATKGPFRGTILPLGSVPPADLTPALAMGSFGQTFILTVGPGEGQPLTPGKATLYKWLPGMDSPRLVADIGAYQVEDTDPYNTNGDAAESNPFGVALLHDGSVLVADAAGNDLLRVYRGGKVVTVARLKPRLVKVPDELPDPPAPFPPAGVPIWSEAVATSVTVGADGYYYVGELRGFPSTTGTSQVWRIRPDSVDAVCDPDAPTTGACRRYADGFTSIVALGAGDDGSIYVVELVKGGWLQWEQELVPPVGGLFRIPRGGGPAKELAADQLILPGGVAVAGSKTVYVTGPVFGPGTLSKIRVSADHHGR